jgi:hypothetical protein
LNELLLTLVQWYDLLGLNEENEGKRERNEEIKVHGVQKKCYRWMAISTSYPSS